MMQTVPTDAALAECASEPIHLLGRIQSFGVLIAFDDRRRIVAASDTTRHWCGREALSLLDSRADAVLPASAVAAAIAHAKVAAATGQAQNLHHVAWPGRAGGADVSVHASGGLVVVEAEPAGASPPGATLAVERCARDLAGHHDVDGLARSATTAVASLTGYDRVMVYRFSADGSGTVIAEHRARGQPSYLGLRYPASDIPPQARTLYLRNPTRVIADAHDDGVPVLTRGSAPLDLSLATLRSVSPVHLEYLRNMGTAASMSISLIVDGALWGLIACHHRRPVRPSLACRAMAESLGRLFSLALSRADRQPLERDIHGLLLSTHGVDPLVDAGHDPAGHDSACVSIGRMMALTGVVTQIEGQVRSWGRAPTEAQTGEILTALAGTSPRPVTAVESLDGLRADLGRLTPDVAGLLALSLGGQGRDWVLLLRDEVERHVRWAGEPGKALQRRPDGRLSPRSSFATWLASVKGHCEPWTVAEQELANVVRTRLIEVLGGRREQRVIESTRQAARQQALLVRELNHRVRNMLGLIKGLVQQTARNASSVEDLTARLHDRVHALARAYTQVEKANWQPTSLSALLQEETGAFGEPGQLDVEGSPVLLEPQAYLSFAMVIHELATNARKYGALSVPQGRVWISWSLSADGGLQVDWRETGGPAVAAPERKGFGTRVIRQGLEHQLHGHATIDFEPSGVHVRLWTPRGFVPQPGKPATRRPHAPRIDPPAAELHAAPMPDTALVVEDDLVIALLAESMLQQLGCSHVITVGTADDALRQLRQQSIGLVLLDVNLGDHSSEPVAQRLIELGIPTIVTTGYSDTDSVPEPLRRLRRLCKPYTKTELALLIPRVMAGAPVPAS